MSAYIQELNRMAKAAAAEAQRMADAAPSLEQRVAAIIGQQTTARIPELQRVLDADPRAIGEALRTLGFGRRRMWSGPEYALTQWQRRH